MTNLHLPTSLYTYSIENSSKKTIKIEYVFVLIIKHPKTIGFAVETIIGEAENKGFKSAKRDVFDPKIVNYLEETYKTKELVTPHLILKSLDYYYIMNKQLGSLENLATTYNFPLMPGLYGVYFYVLGKNWFKGNSHSRGVHDEILI